MSNTVMDINALPQLLLQLFSTSRVSVSETDGGIHVVPLKRKTKRKVLLMDLSEYLLIILKCPLINF